MDHPLTSMASHVTRLPNFLIIGAQKAGTTALYYALSRHPDIFMSPVKEPAYFTAENAFRDTSGPGDETAQVITDLHEYETLFAEGQHVIARGEASTSYLYDANAAEKIKHLIPDVKLIAILRNPVDRAYSNFLHLRRDGREPLRDFRAALAEEGTRNASGWSVSWRYKEKGFYGIQLEKYLTHFSRGQIRWYLYEEYDDDPYPTVTDIYKFLGVDDTVSQDLSTRLNVGGMPRSESLQWLTRRITPAPQDPNNTSDRRLKWLINRMPDRLRRGLLNAQNTNLERPSVLSTDLRAELMEAYQDDIERVGELTGLNVSRWLKSA